jgi:hypothetical protein
MHSRSDEDQKIIRNGMAPPVERLMMNAATGKTVVGSVRSSELAPPDVSSLNPQISIIELYRVSTECALMAPCGHYRSAKSGIAERISGRSLQIQADRAGNARMQRLRKVRRKYLTSQFAYRFRPSRQFLENLRGKTAADAPLA